MRRCKHGSTVLENNRRDFIRTIRLPRVKISEGRRNIIMKDLNIRHDVVSAWRRRKNKSRLMEFWASWRTYLIPGRNIKSMSIRK